MRHTTSIRPWHGLSYSHLTFLIIRIDDNSFFLTFPCDLRHIGCCLVLFGNRILLILPFVDTLLQITVVLRIPEVYI